MTNAQLIVALCAAQVLLIVGVFAFPALLPTFIAEWQLSHTEAGWISGLYFAAYALTAPPVLALTDRVDARLVFLTGTVMSAVAAAAFACLADGFWTALGFRALAGVALAAIYLPGVRVLLDRYRGSQPSRGLSFYTASFSLGTALSFLMVGEIAAAWGWRMAFLATAGAAGLAAVVPLLLVAVVPEKAAARRPLLDFRPVFANRKALAFVLGYGIHCWELFALRSWMVAFLAFSISLQSPVAAGWLSSALMPTSIAALGGLVAMAASIGGNELCVRFGRRQVISRVMLASAVAACIIGFTAPINYAVVAIATLAYTALVQLDSAALTAATIEAAEPGERGATLAVHGFVGFGAAGLGPLFLGVALDVSGGGETAASWGVAFASIGLIGLLGPLALRLAADQCRSK